MRYHELLSTEFEHKSVGVDGVQCGKCHLTIPHVPGTKLSEAYLISHVCWGSTSRFPMSQRLFRRPVANWGHEELWDL